MNLYIHYILYVGVIFCSKIKFNTYHVTSFWIFIIISVFLSTFLLYELFLCFSNHSHGNTYIHYIFHYPGLEKNHTDIAANYVSKVCSTALRRTFKSRSRYQAFFSSLSSNQPLFHWSSNTVDSVLFAGVYACR